MTVTQAISRIDKAQGAEIKGGTITVNRFGVGIGTWGAIDFLVKKHKYVLVRA